jgi:hypothetical protein
MGFVGRMDPIQDRFDVAGDDGQRCPQLVGDVGEEAPPLCRIGFEPRRHRVEAAGEGPDRRRRGSVENDTSAVVAGLDAGGLLDQVVEHPARAPDRPAAADDPRDGGDRQDGCRQADQVAGGPRCREDRPDEARREREQPEHTDQEHEAEQTPEPSPSAAAAGRRPRFVGRPPGRPTPTARPRRSPRAVPAPATATHARSSARR